MFNIQTWTGIDKVDEVDLSRQSSYTTYSPTPLLPSNTLPPQLPLPLNLVITVTSTGYLLFVLNIKIY